MTFTPYFRLRLFVLPACILLALFVPATATAQQGDSGAIAQGFQIEGSSSDFVGGALVSTKSTNPRVVQLATNATANRLAGVVSEQPLVALSGGGSKVQVVISGTTNVLVSDINGIVKAGDKITASPVQGVGMLAGSGSQVVGTAQATFDAGSASAQTITDAKGKQRTIHINRLSLQINVSYYQSPSSGLIPPFVQGLANNIAGRSVSLVRIAICAILLLLACIGTAAVLYTSIRSGLISIGRNPLAARAIRLGLLQIGIAVVLTLALTLLGSYIILTV